MNSKKGFFDKYYFAKTLSRNEFFKKRFRNIEMVIFALLVAVILSFTDDLFIFNTGLNPSDKTMFLVLVFVVSVLFYRSFLYKKHSN